MSSGDRGGGERVSDPDPDRQQRSDSNATVTSGPREQLLFLPHYTIYNIIISYILYIVYNI